MNIGNWKKIGTMEKIAFIGNRGNIIIKFLRNSALYAEEYEFNKILKCYKAGLNVVILPNRKLILVSKKIF